MSKLVYVGGGKGGTTKSTTSHMLCLGAVLCGQPAAYALTDPTRQLKAEGRPYGVLDGRDPVQLAHIIKASQSTLNGWLIIDGGGNRPDFDKAMSAEVGLCLLPFRDSEEDLESVARDLQAMPNAMAWPAAWPTNRHAADAAQRYIDALTRAFPLRIVSPPLHFINSAKELLDAKLGNPSTQVRSAARRAFGIMVDQYDAHSPKDASETADRLIA
jgi:chromosome partitioning protein